MATKSKQEALDELTAAAEAFLAAKNGRKREQAASELRISGNRYYRAIHEAGAAKAEKEAKATPSE